MSASLDWSDELSKQLSWHWDNQARPRLQGLSDDEYFWEPAFGAWNVRPRGQGVAMEVGGGDYIIDFALPEPVPPPVTTIAWRLGHILVGVLGSRNATYFDGPEVSYDSYAFPGTAAAALSELDHMYQRWIAGVRSLGADRLAQRCREPGFESESMAALVLHIHRELIHHLAEIALLRDLYPHRPI
ncbi:MAG: hypothetical protein JWN06_1961 [Propionibacteriaceae bacterium]|jgi:hypothetical protein|nr:hypothetical protein [Propionibacteriaceae bacterium]